MPIIRSSKSLAILVTASLLFPAKLIAADNNVVTATAEILKGNCGFSTSTYSIEFPSQTVSSFRLGNAAAVMPLKVLYECEGFEANSKMAVITMGSVSSDTKVFASSTSTATGVGFMLKDGEVTETAGFYNAGRTLGVGDKFTADMKTQGEYTLSVGFVKQNTSTPVTSGDVTASVMLMFVLY
jgi:hypothetical protein